VDLDDFWSLIDRSGAAETDRQRRAAWLSAQLAKRPADDIVAFELHLAAQRGRVDTWRMWGVGLYLMQGLCSTDAFFYFQPWLVGLGRTTFERVVADPDALADVPEVIGLAGRPADEWADDEWPEWELLNYAALEAYELATGDANALDDDLDARGLGRVCDPSPEGDSWDYESPTEREALIPRLSALLG
jgi:uncharacterized protein DUF4240